MTRYLCLLLVAAAWPLIGVEAATPPPWCAVPLQRWSEGITWDVNDQFPPPYGIWAETPSGVAASGVSASGKAPLWSTRLLPGEQGAAQKVAVTFTVDQPSTGKRELPGNCYRWGFHWGENLPGWDVGVVLRYKDPLHFYRVQLSAARGELGLWDAQGAFLQLIPVTLAAGQPHRLGISARGAHFEAWLDGQPVLDYWDRVQPCLSGRVGLAVYQSQVRFSNFSVSPAPAETRPVPAHKPSFSLETAEGVRAGDPAWGQAPTGSVVLFDGREPISFFYKTAAGEFFQDMVKLQPGGRPAYYTQAGPALNYKWPQLVGELPGAMQVEEGGQTLGCRLQMTGAPGALSAQTVTVSYDSSRGVYRYEYRVKQTFTNTQPLDLFNYQVMDPLTYNNRFPGPEVENRWSPTGHRWWVFQGPDGGWRRMPMVDFLTDHNNPSLQWKATDFLYPDAAASPVFQVEYGWPQPDKWNAGMGLCTWGYDYHHWAGAYPVMKLKAGDELDYTLVYTAFPPAEARANFQASKLREGLETDKTPLLIFDPLGGPLQTTTWQDPRATMIWNGDGVTDPSGGRQGRPALRWDGPGQALVYLYQYMIEQHASRWWVRGWFRTRGVRGRGVQLQVKYAYQAQPQDTFYLGGRGDQAWTYFSFLTTALTARDCSTLSFSLDGPGQVWLDGVALSALKAGASPPTTTFAMPPGLEPSQDILIDLAMTDRPGKAVYDESRNGHALLLKGADPGVAGPEWRQEEGRGFLHFTGKEAAQLAFQPVLQGLDAPPEVTPEVLDKCGVTYEGYKPIFPLKQFTYEWWMRPEKPDHDPGRMTLFHSRLNPICCLDQPLAKPGEAVLSYQGDLFCGAKIRLQHAVSYAQWTHVVLTHGAGKVVLYLNGEKAAEADYDPAGPGFWMNRPILYFGRWMAGMNGGGMGFNGDLGPFRLYARALTPDEVAQRYHTGWPTASAPAAAPAQP